MGNGTNVSPNTIMHQHLTRVVEAYQEVLRADERRLHEAMLDYEMACWAQRLRRAA